MVTVPTENGGTMDLTKKQDIEKAILMENASKFQQSFNSPFYTTSLAMDFGSKALTPAAKQVLLGIYSPPHALDETVTKYIKQLAFPPVLQILPPKPNQDFVMPLNDHIPFWKGAKENTSCFPCALSFATMKAGSKDKTIAELDCLAAQIPLQGGFAPDAWQYATDVMIPKKSGVTLLSGL
jgi:hypothetical protein